jgi:hypothetical protein
MTQKGHGSEFNSENKGMNKHEVKKRPKKSHSFGVKLQIGLTEVNSDIQRASDKLCVTRINKSGLMQMKTQRIKSDQCLLQSLQKIRV